MIVQSRTKWVWDFEKKSGQDIAILLFSQRFKFKNFPAQTQSSDENSTILIKKNAFYESVLYRGVDLGKQPT